MTIIQTTDRRQAEQQLVLGGRLKRLAHDMILEISDAPDDTTQRPPQGIVARELNRNVRALAEGSASSTPPGHPDHAFWPDQTARLAYWQQLLAGEDGRPILPGSSELRGDGGDLIGALVLTHKPPTAWWKGGAWISELFVVPSYQGRGLGTLLLRHAIRASRLSQEQRLGLTVTDGSPAERLYARLGFSRLRSVYLIEV